MTYDPDIHHRRSIRLKGYDYAQAGLYVVTICVQDRACLFGDVVDGAMHLTDAGRMVHAVWSELPVFYPGVAVDAFVVMPNHVHGIIELTPSDPDDSRGGPPWPPSDPFDSNTIENDAPGPRGQAPRPAPTERVASREEDVWAPGPGQAEGPRGQAQGPAPTERVASHEEDIWTPGPGQARGAGGQAQGAGGQAQGPAPTDPGDDADSPVGAAPRGRPNPIPGDRPDLNTFGRPGPTVEPVLSLPDVMHRFKTLTTKRYADGVRASGWPPFNGRLWQRNYYERVVRNDAELERFRRYIAENPLRWNSDEENPRRILA